MNSVRTQLDKLYEDGGPAKLNAELPDKSVFKSACNEYPLQRIAGLLREYCADEQAIRRHWPWVAVALDRYVFEVKERQKYSDERSPKQWKELVQAIANAAHELSNNLMEARSASYRLIDPAAPLRRAHIAWLDELFARAMAGRADSAESDDDLQTTINHFARLEFLRRLAGVEKTAKAAIKGLDKKLLTGKRGQNNPALDQFVGLSARIWESLTQRRSSAQRLNSKDREDPDFVVLLSKLAKIGEAPTPSRREIETSLRNLRRPTD